MRIAFRAAVLAALALPAFGGGQARAQSAPAECNAATRTDPALTVYPDVSLYTEQFGDERVSGPPLPFRTRVTILPGPRKGGRVLVRTADGSQCGYVESSRILAGNPLRILDIDPSQLIRTTIFGVVGNTWPARAMLRSNPRIDAAAGEVQLFDAPGGKGRPFRSLRAFSLFNVFKVEKKGADQDDWWYFVGGSRVADDKVLSGWVRGGNLFLWGSSLAVYSAADKSARFDVYADLESLRKGAKEGQIATRSELEPPEHRAIAKFPILNQIFKDPTDLMAGRLPIAYEIGFVGRACGTAGDCDHAGKIGDKRARIGEVARTAAQIDVMLVIGNTGGMTRYFAPIARAVSQWAGAASAKHRGKGRIRFGAAIYGDYRDRQRPSKENMDFRLIAQLDTDASKLARGLTAVETPFADAVGDQPEAGYAALVRAAQEGFWAEDTAYRLLFWIGDQGVQRAPGKLPFDPVSATDVQRELKDRRLTLIPINVAGNWPETSTFVEDATRLLDGSKLALGVPAIRTFGKGVPARQEPETAAQMVTEFLEETLRHSKATQEWLQAQRGKSLAPKASDLPLVFGIDPALMGDPFARLGLTPEEVHRVLSLRQLMTRGYVSFDTQRKNIAFFAAVEPYRFSILQGSLSELCRAMGEDDDLRSRLLGLMLNLAHALGGAPYSPTETLAEYFDRLVFLPRLPIKTWLDKSPTELAGAWGVAGAGSKERMRFSVCRSAYLLGQMGAGQKVESMDDLEFDAMHGKVQLKPGRRLRPYAWLWSAESGIEFYFVPVEYLPRDDH